MHVNNLKSMSCYHDAELFCGTYNKTERKYIRREVDTGGCMGLRGFCHIGLPAQSGSTDI